MQTNRFFLKIKLGVGSFRNFAIFDAFVRQKKMRRPVSIGIAAFIGSSISFSFQEANEYAFLLGVLLCVIAVGVPGNFFRTFFGTLKEQTTKMNLDKPRHVYTVELTNISTGVRYYYPDDKKIAGQYAWKSLVGIWRTDKAIYIYVEPDRALLIPYTTQNVDLDVLWQFLCKQVSEEKLHDTRGRAFLKTLLSR